MRIFRGRQGPVPISSFSMGLTFSGHISNRSPRPDYSVKLSPDPPWINTQLPPSTSHPLCSNLLLFLYCALIYGLATHSKVLVRSAYKYCGYWIMNCSGKKGRKGLWDLEAGTKPPGETPGSLREFQQCDRKEHSLQIYNLGLC
jgi:hypothetical protein